MIGFYLLAGKINKLRSRKMSVMIGFEDRRETEDYRHWLFDCWHNKLTHQTGFRLFGVTIRFWL